MNPDLIFDDQVGDNDDEPTKPYIPKTSITTMKEKLIAAAENYGYKKKGFGYCKIIGDTKHRISFGESNDSVCKAEMYAFTNGNEKEYATGLFLMDLSDLNTIMRIFVK